MVGLQPNCVYLAVAYPNFVSTASSPGTFPNHDHRIARLLACFQP
jgi:hypothetical protein